MKMTSERLKPCPFCGSEGKLYSFGEVGYKVECTNNFCQASYMIGAIFDTESEAICRWNVRYDEHGVMKNDI